MEKGFWKIAPTWAKYWAVDSDGTCYWYERKPRVTKDIWYSDGESEFAGRIQIDPNENWKTLIIERPDDE